MDIYTSPAAEPSDRLDPFHRRNNEIRPHWALAPMNGGDVVTPADVYRRGVTLQVPAWQGWERAAREKLDALLERDAQAA